MADTPYKYTVCPPQEAPKQFTASCREMGELLKASPDGDLTIDDRRNGYWQTWDGRRVEVAPLEELVHAMAVSAKERTDG
jgi:hypothetical protein